MWLWLLLWLLLWELEVIRRLLTRNLCKLVEKDITLRKFMFQTSKFAYSSLCCILRRGLQCVDSVINCRSSVCCCCLQRIDALLQFDDLRLSICKLLRQAVKITRNAWKQLTFSTCDALCDQLF